LCWLDARRRCGLNARRRCGLCGLNARWWSRGVIGVVIVPSPTAIAAMVLAFSTFRIAAHPSPDLILVPPIQPCAPLVIMHVVEACLHSIGKDFVLGIAVESVVTQQRVANPVNQFLHRSSGHEQMCGLAGDDPLGETPVGLRVHMLVRAKPEKEQERGRRAEKRALREGRQ